MYHWTVYRGFVLSDKQRGVKRMAKHGENFFRTGKQYQCWVQGAYKP